MSAVLADVWADIICWILMSAPAFALHHWFLKRHITKITAAQTRTLQGEETR